MEVVKDGEASYFLYTSTFSLSCWKYMKVIKNGEGEREREQILYIHSYYILLVEDI